MTERVSIRALGAQGDGIAHRAGDPGEPFFVPFTLPGETVDVEPDGARGRLMGIVEGSTERIAPPCPHFGRCGGCDLQHAGDALYAAFKTGLVADALRHRGLDAPLEALVRTPPATRRRATFSAQRAGGQLTFGFFEALTNRVLAIEVCLIVVPEIARRLDDLRRVAAAAAGRRAPLKMIVTATATGLDVALGDTAPLTETLRRALVRLALDRDFARLSVEGDVLVESRVPQVAFGGVTVAPPPGAFLQAAVSTEGAMVDLVTRHLAGARQAADFFAGVGTFALALAAASAVHAVEADAPALAALAAARRGAPQLKPVTTERRDLFRRPPTAKELERFDAVVFDPPRAGAEGLARVLAASKVARIAAVSCNPATLARDLQILAGGGYRIRSVTPIDQFVWSHHVEAVALLER